MVKTNPQASIIRWIPLVLLSLVAILFVLTLISTTHVFAQNTVPANWDSSQLYGSWKEASTHRIDPTETFTYSVGLVNSSVVTATFMVTDVIPADLDYIPGTATRNGVYDPQTRMLTWTGLEVSPSDVDVVFFKAIPNVNVETEKEVVNVAHVSVNGYQMTPQTRVYLIPQAYAGDSEKPVIKSVTIGDRDILTDPVTAIHISATDNVGIKYMYIKEWALHTNQPKWNNSFSSGWIPFQADYSWTLQSAEGIHYVGVWVADGALNMSQLDHNAIDFANLTLANTTFPSSALVPYLVAFKGGDAVEVMLNVASGAPDLFIWYPDNFLAPDHQLTGITGMATVQFVAPKDGKYIVLVRTNGPITFTMSITPAGGPRVASASLPVNILPVFDQPGSNPEAVIYEPIFMQSGLDPLASVYAPGIYPSFHQIYLPLSIR